MILRPYQSAAVDAVMAALDERPILVSPTGSGKSFMGAEIVRRFAGRVLWVVHRRELVHQAADHIGECGLILAGEKPSDHRVQVASVQTLARRTMPEADLIIVDEAHHAAAESYSFLAGRRIVGLTATPFRLDGRPLGPMFGRIIVAAYTDDLCRDGTLIAPTVYVPPGPDMTGVRMIGGDYEQGVSAERMAKLTGGIVEHYVKHGMGKRAVAFAVNVEHSKLIAASLGGEHLDGDSPTEHRKAVLERLRSGAINVLSNCMILGEGWDLPALEVAIIARPTASLALHLQMIGRIMRRAPDKLGAVVLDHAGNHHRHGPVTQRLEYSLDGVVRRGATRTGLRTCPECYLMVPLGLRECPSCGYEFPGPEAPEVTPGELKAYTAADWQDFAAAWAMIEEQRTAFGFKPGWSIYRFRERFGFAPLVIGGRIVDPKRAGMSEKAMYFRELDSIRQSKGFKPGWTAWRYKAAFGVWPRGVR